MISILYAVWHASRTKARVRVAEKKAEFSHFFCQTRGAQGVMGYEGGKMLSEKVLDQISRLAKVEAHSYRSRGFRLVPQDLSLDEWVEGPLHGLWFRNGGSYDDFREAFIAALKEELAREAE
jgi:hypothetical protein